MKKFKNKYRIQSNRWQKWDYSSHGAYFITICTQNRIHYLGKIVDGKMYLSEIGEIVNTEWLRTFEMRPDMNLYMDEFVIMPNHFHAIIVIGENKYNTFCRDAMHCVSTFKSKNKFGSQSKNLASIVRGFKIGVTINARKIDQNFAWQSNYYDHIIRNNKSYENIRNYIRNNPKNWQNDRFYK